MPKRKRRPRKLNTIDDIRWNLKTLNIPRTRNLANFFLMSNEEEEQEKLEETKREQWLSFS